jgi:hypothetical protein
MIHVQRRTDVIASTRHNKTVIVGVDTTACGALYPHPGLEHARRLSRDDRVKRPADVGSQILKGVADPRGSVLLHTQEALV